MVDVPIHSACGRSHTLPYYIGNAHPIRPRTQLRGTKDLGSDGHLADAPEPLGPPVGEGPLQHGSHWLELERGGRLLAQNAQGLVQLGPAAFGSKATECRDFASFAPVDSIIRGRCV